MAEALVHGLLLHSIRCVPLFVDTLIGRKYNFSPIAYVCTDEWFVVIFFMLNEYEKYEDVSVVTLHLE